MSAASLDSGLTQIALSVDASRASPQFIQDLWDVRHAGSRLAGKLVMTHAPGYDADVPDLGKPWWARQGSARVFLTSSDTQLAMALADFIIDNRILFSRVWVGDGASRPADDQVRDLSTLLEMQSGEHVGGVA